MNSKAFRKLSLLPEFSRNRTTHFQYLAWRESLLDHYMKNYDFFQTYGNYEGEFGTVNIYGKTGYLIKSVDESYESANYVLAGIEKFKPKVILLGGLSPHDIDRFTEGPEKYQKTPFIYQRIEDLLAKEKMTSYFVRTMPLSDKHFKIPELNLIFEPSKTQHSLTFSDNLSAAYSACIDLTSKLLFAKPDIHLFLEDLALRISLEELRVIFFDVMQAFIEEAKNDPKFICLHDVDSIYRFISDMAKDKYGLRLYEKLIVYHASLLRTSLRLFGDSALLSDYYFYDYVAVLMNEPILPEFDSIFRTYLDENQAPNPQSQKRRSIKRMGKALNDAIKNDEERIKIQKMLNESDSKYNYRKKELPLFESLFKMEADEIIEKYVILNHLISNDVKFHLQNDSNPFKVSIFKDIISKKYPETDNILQKFNEINEKYRVILHKTQNFLISRIKNHDSGGRLVYKTIKEQEEIMSSRLKKGPLDFTVGVLNRLKQQALVSHLLYLQIQKIIKRKMSKGIPQDDVLLQLRNLSEGLYTKKNLQTFLLLISEANAELRLLKLPAYYKSTFPAIKGKLVSELEGTLTNILNFVNTEMDFNFKDPKTKEIKKLNVYLTSQNMPLQNFEKLFKKTKDEENFDKPFSEYMNSTEKKIYTILYGPEGEKQPEIPEDIEMKTSEELEAMGFKAVESLEFEANEKGEIIGDDMNEEKKEKMMEIMKNLADKKEK